MNMILTSEQLQRRYLNFLEHAEEVLQLSEKEAFLSMFPVNPDWARTTLVNIVRERKGARDDIEKMCFEGETPLEPWEVGMALSTNAMFKSILGLVMEFDALVEAAGSSSELKNKLAQFRNR